MAFKTSSSVVTPAILIRGSLVRGLTSFPSSDLASRAFLRCVLVDRRTAKVGEEGELAIMGRRGTVHRSQGRGSASVVSLERGTLGTLATRSI